MGPVLGMTLLAEVPELGELGGKQIASLLGVAPFSDSGTLRGRRRRAPARQTLYMATLTATRHNPVIRDFYLRLCGSGKAKKVALTACMRKLLVILNHAQARRRVGPVVRENGGPSRTEPLTFNTVAPRWERVGVRAGGGGGRATLLEPVAQGYAKVSNRTA